MAEKNKVKDEQGEDETTSSNGGDYSWGTLEELLLACAVNRHGSNSWDSIADELQKRVKLTVSPSDCHQKYLHLKRRFHFDEDDGELLRVVDELRKLRVEELKHEVQRHDVSIVSLKMKVKRLEEEREKSLSKVEEPEKETDLRTEPDENGRKTGEKPDGSSPEKVITGDSAENRSFNESNSTNHNKKGDKPAVIDERELKSKREPEETSNEPDPVRYRSKDEPGKDRTSRPGESVSESKRESVKQQQQSSDVQSSASLSKKKRRRFRGLGGGGGSSGDEAEEISPANKRISVKSQPLIRFFEILQSHKHGSVFQRRLPSQETEKYRNIVRQHMDLDTVQSKLEKGNYSECHPKFYRDILLIFTNAVLFYRKSSAEHIAARELRKVVIEEIAHRASKPNKAQIIKPDGELQHLEPVLVKKPRSSTTMVVCRRRSSSSMQALSETIKSRSDPNHASSNNNNNNNISKKGGGDDENNNNNNKNNNDSTNSSNVVVSRKEEENEKNGGGGGGGEGVVVNGKKVVTKERSSLGRVGLRLSNSSNSTSKKKMIDNSNKESNNNREKVVKKPGNKKEESGEGEVGETMNRKKMANGDEKQEKGTTTLKKQGVANFLKRMKQNSPSQLKDDHESEEEEDLKVEREKEEKKREKTSNNDNNNGKKRNGNVKRNRGDNEGVVTRGGNEGRRGEREVDGGSRRATGRPPKRKAALMSSSGRSSNTTDSGKGGGRSVFIGRDSGEKSKKKPRR